MTSSEILVQPLTIHTHNNRIAIDLEFLHTPLRINNVNLLCLMQHMHCHADYKCPILVPMSRMQHIIATIEEGEGE